MTRKWLPILILLAAAGAGCDRPTTTEWKQPIRFLDGSDGVLTRTTTQHRIWGVPRDACCPVEQDRISLDGTDVVWTPDTARVRFDSLPKGKMGMTVNTEYIGVRPISLDRIGSAYVLAGIPFPYGDVLVNYCLQNPDRYNVMFFVWREGRWVPVPQTDALVDGARQNIVETHPQPGSGGPLRAYLDANHTCRGKMAMLGDRVP